jgi:hypothetical protein
MEAPNKKRWFHFTWAEVVVIVVIIAVVATVVVAAPDWLLVAIGAIAAPALVKQSLRFSLRTMLIATTLLAVVLGLGVWIAS